jgi:hypothetical protein
MKIKIASDDVGALMAVLRRKRAELGLSLLHMAGHMDVSDRVVQRMEEAVDVSLQEADEVPVGDLKAYVDALGGTLRIEVELP